MNLFSLNTVIKWISLCFQSVNQAGLHLWTVKLLDEDRKLKSFPQSFPLMGLTAQKEHRAPVIQANVIFAFYKGRNNRTRWSKRTEEGNVPESLSKPPSSVTGSFLLQKPTFKFHTKESAFVKPERLQNFLI